MINRMMISMTSGLKMKVEKQIKGKGAKEKLETYLEFMNAESTELSKTLITEVLPEIYANHFTPNEIIDLIVFYETPTGKKLLSETPEITKDLMTAIYTNYIPDFQKKLKKKLAQLDGNIWKDAYRVKPEEVIVCNCAFSAKEKIVRIKNDKKAKETYVTLAVPIHENKFWIRFDKNIDLIDRSSNEHYLALRLDNNLVLNKTMIVSDQANKMIEVTLVFPLLNKSVETFDIVETISDDADLMSNNGGDDNNLNNIKLKDYLVK